MDSDVFNLINGMTRQGTFERVLSNIKIAATMAKRFGGNLFLNTVLRKDNVAETESLHEFAEEIGALIAFYGLEVAPPDGGINIRANDPSLVSTGKDREQLAETFKSLMKLKKSRKNSIFMSHYILQEFLNFFNDPKGDMHWKCNAGKMYLELLPEGTFSVCNATPPIPGYDYKTLPEFYARQDTEDVFNKYRTTCGGCICTRQLENIAIDRGDLFDKMRVYLSTMLGRR
jgi:sulfatase maturation enzyme AslB (radical SAM superfamily)